MTIELDYKLTKEEILKAAHFAELNLTKFYDEFKVSDFAKDIDTDESHWTDDYYHTQRVYLEANFSKKRLDHVLNVRKKLKGS